MSEQSYEPSSGVPTGPRAGFWRRFVALLLDGILLGIVNGILMAVMDDNAASGLSVAIGLAYFTFLEGGASGQTLGKKAFSIRVIDRESGGPIGYGRAIVRYIGRIVSTIPVLLGYLWMLWDDEKQTWHDKFANSIVVPTSAYPVS